MGLHQAAAIKYSRRISSLLKTLKVYAETAHDLSLPESRLKLIHLLREFLLEDYRNSITAEQLLRFERAMNDRVLNIINREQFTGVLKDSFRVGGVGLKIMDAARFSEKLETILAQFAK